MGALVIGALRVDLGLESSAFERGATRAQAQAAALGRKFENIGKGFASVGKALTLGLTVPLVGFGVMAAKAASDAGELKSAFDQTFGALANSMNDWAVKTGNAMGRSTQELQTAANAFGLFFNQAAPTREAAAGLSRDFTVLAQDLASFHNTKPEEALLALRSGLSGESEPLRRYGVFLNDAAVQAKALEIGLKPVNGKLTDQQKILARSALIMEATKNAQGDVARTSSSTANQVRAATAAWDELKVTIGEKLLPIITPLIGKVTELLNKFSELSPGTQSFIVGAAAVAAALGPIAFGIGSIMQVAGPFLGWLVGFVRVAASAGSIGGGLQAIFAGLSAGGGTIMAALAPVLPIVAAVAAAGALIYANWEKIGPVLGELGAKFQEVLGPKIGAMIQAVSQTLQDLWAGPLGDGIRKVTGFLGNLAAAFLKVFGETLVRTIGAAISLLQGSFQVIGDLISVVVKLLTGDWAGAWNSAKALVGHVVQAIVGAVEALVPGATDAVRRLYEGFKNWLQDKLGAVVNWLAEKLGWIGDLFFQLYDRVVGHSYVPDMVQGIISEMARLDAGMVKVAEKATSKTAKAFKDMAAEVLPLLDRLFPEAASARSFKSDLDLLAKAEKAGPSKGGISKETADAARQRLLAERLGIDMTGQGQSRETGLFSSFGNAVGGFKDGLKTKLGDLHDAIQVELVERSKNQLSEVVKAWADMARNVVGSVQDMVSRFKSGDILGGIMSFLDTLQGVIGAISAIKSGGSPGGGSSGGGYNGGIGGMISSIASSASSILGAFGGGRAMGGPVVPGMAYRVGERGPEYFVPGQKGAIVPGNGMGGRAVNIFQGNLLTNEFWAEIQRRDDHAAMRGSVGGAQIAMERANRSRSRRLPS